MNLIWFKILNGDFLILTWPKKLYHTHPSVENNINYEQNLKRTIWRPWRVNRNRWNSKGSRTSMFRWGEAETDQNENTLVLLVWRTKHRVRYNCKPWKVCVCTWRRRSEHKPQGSSRRRGASCSVHELCSVLNFMWGTFQAAQWRLKDLNQNSDCSLYIVGEIGFCSLSSVKKIDCLKEKGKKESWDRTGSKLFTWYHSQYSWSLWNYSVYPETGKYVLKRNQQRLTLGLLKCWNWQTGILPQLL